MVDTPTSAADPFVGRTFGSRYRIIDRLDSGGMGSVYRAEHLLMNRRVAIKILPQQHAQDERTRKRFEAEARISCQVNHPNAVLLHDFGFEDEMPYLVMEFLEGKTLKQALGAKEPISLRRLRTIIEQVCGALAEAHSHGIIHRDIKPSNIMLQKIDPDHDRVKVLDFGVAKVLKGTIKQGTDLTLAGAIVGTPKYLSPEQGLSKELDVRSDIYSLGCVMYEVITGTPPFDASSSIELIVQHVNVAPTPIRKKRPDLDISQRLDDLVMKCLEKDPLKRYQDVNELLADVKRSFPSGGQSSTTLSVLQGMIMQAPDGETRRLRPSFVVGAGLVGVLVPTLYLFSGSLFASASKSQGGETSVPAVEKSGLIDGASSEEVRGDSTERSALLQEISAGLDDQKASDGSASQGSAESTRTSAEVAAENERLAAEREEQIRREAEEEASKKMAAMKAELQRQAELMKQADEEKQAALREATAEKEAELRRAEAGRQRAKDEADRLKQALADQEAAVERAKQEHLMALRMVRRQRRLQSDTEPASNSQAKAPEKATSPAVVAPPVVPPTVQNPPESPADQTAPEGKRKRKRCGPNWCM